jgi:hypothetical protein
VCRALLLDGIYTFSNVQFILHLEIIQSRSLVERFMFLDCSDRVDYATKQHRDRLQQPRMCRVYLQAAIIHSIWKRRVLMYVMMSDLA